MYHLSSWKRFWRLEVPHAIRPRLEHVDVGLGRLVLCRRLGGDHCLRPDHHAARHRVIIATAGIQQDLRDRATVVVMFVVILLYDRLLFRRCSPGHGFGRSSTDEDIRPWFLIVLQRARVRVSCRVLEVNRIIDSGLAAWPGGEDRRVERQPGPNSVQHRSWARRGRGSVDRPSSTRQ